MALPEQTFNTLGELVNYTNTDIVPNGRKEINGVENNNVLNGLAKFIPEYTMNAVDGADVVTAGGAIVLSRPITIFNTVKPTSVTWTNNVQKEYYISNPFSQVIDIVGSKSYFDNNLINRTQVPPKSILHIAQAENGSWVQIATSSPSDAPVGGGGNGQGNLF